MARGQAELDSFIKWEVLAADDSDVQSHAHPDPPAEEQVDAALRRSRERRAAEVRPYQFVSCGAATAARHVHPQPATRQAQAPFYDPRPVARPAQAPPFYHPRPAAKPAHAPLNPRPAAGQAQAPFNPRPAASQAWAPTLPQPAAEARTSEQEELQRLREANKQLRQENKQISEKSAENLVKLNELRDRFWELSDRVARSRQPPEPTPSPNESPPRRQRRDQLPPPSSQQPQPFGRRMPIDSLVALHPLEYLDL